MSDPIEKAKSDLDNFAKAINKLDNEIQRLQSERNRLATGQSRVRAFVEMYGHYVTKAEENDNDGESGKSLAVKPKPLRRRVRLNPKVQSKPGGTPTVPQMIKEALLTAAIEDKEGLAPREMADYIRKKYWPHAKGERISPIAWRMWKSGELLKDGETYRLPAS